MQFQAKAQIKSYKEAMLGDACFDKKYMRKKYPTEEEYYARSTTFHTYAVVTPSGKWYEAGRMGWWGISSATLDDERAWELGYHDRFIKPAIANNWYMVIVDCHI